MGFLVTTLFGLKLMASGDPSGFMLGFIVLVLGAITS